MKRNADRPKTNPTYTRAALAVGIFLMRQKALYPAILATAFLMMVIVSGLATIPTLYRQMALAQINSPAPAHTAVSPVQDNSAPTIDLQALSTLTLLGTSLNLILRGPRQPRAMIGPSDGAPRLFDPATPGLRGALRSVFLHWLLVRAAGFELTMWLLRRFLKRHYSAPLTALIALRQRESLADIGKTVAKINHDMRNVLGSATLVPTR